MDVWATFWGWLLAAVLVIFALLAVAVAIGGFFDVKALFETIDEQHQEDEPG